MQRTSPTPPPDQDDQGQGELLGYPEAAARLGLHVGTLRSMVHRRLIPHVRLAPRIVRFATRDIAEYISARRVAPR